MRICKWDENPGVKRYRSAEPEETQYGDPRWKAMSSTEVNEFKRQLCYSCKYLGRMDGLSGHAGGTMCTYYAKEKKCRKCSPLECVEKGYFKAREKRRRSVRLLDQNMKPVNIRQEKSGR